MIVSPAVQVVLEVATCPICAMPFAAPQYFFAKRRDEKGQFHCPLGHQMTFTPSTADKLQKELTECRAQLLEAYDLNEKHMATADRLQRTVARLKKKVMRYARAR